MAWLLIFGLGLPVLGWFVACLGPYVLLDMPGRIAGGGELPFDPKDVYPTDGVFIVLEPVWIAMFVLGWLAMLGLGPLFGFIGFVALVVAAARRGVTWQHRLAAAGAGVALLAAAFGGFLGQSFTDLGGTAALLGLLAGGLGVAGRGLPRGQRIALCVLCGAALAVFGVLNSPMGDPLLNWYQD
jgi:hypothetical protein